MVCECCGHDRREAWGIEIVSPSGKRVRLEVCDACRVTASRVLGIDAVPVESETEEFEAPEPAD